MMMVAWRRTRNPPSYRLSSEDSCKCAEELDYSYEILLRVRLMCLRVLACFVQRVALLAADHTPDTLRVAGRFALPRLSFRNTDHDRIPPDLSSRQAPPRRR